jgi:hypothetical protein
MGLRDPKNTYGDDKVDQLELLTQPFRRILLSTCVPPSPSAMQRLWNFVRVLVCSLNHFKSALGQRLTALVMDPRDLKRRYNICKSMMLSCFDIGNVLTSSRVTRSSLSSYKDDPSSFAGP